MNKSWAWVAALCFASAASAAEATADSVAELLDVMKAERTVDAMLVNVEQLMRQSMTAALKGQSLPAEQQRLLDTMAGKFANILREELGWPTMKPVYVQIYQESLTQEEVEGLIGFYKSPAGIALVEKMPLVMQKSMAITQTRMAPVMDKMKAALQEAAAEVKSGNR